MVDQTKLDDILSQIVELDEIVHPNDKHSITSKVISGRQLAYQKDLETVGDYNQSNENPMIVEDDNQSNLIISKSRMSNLHLPVIDLDFECYLIPSSPSHNHLLINRYLTHAHYEKLINTLYEIGLIQTGIKTSFDKQGYTAIRKIDKVKEDVNGFWGFKPLQELFRKYRLLCAENQAQRNALNKCHKIIEDQNLEILALKKKEELSNA